MVYALTVGIVLGMTIGAVLVDVLFVQPMQRENRELARACRRFETNAKDWQRLCQSWREYHSGTPYMPSTVERAKVAALISDIAAQADTLDHSKAAELRVVR